MPLTLKELNKFLSVKRNNEGTAKEISAFRASIIKDKHGRIVDEFGPDGDLSFSPEGWLLYRGQPVRIKPEYDEEHTDLGDFEFVGSSLNHTSALNDAEIGSSGHILFSTNGSEDNVLSLTGDSLAIKNMYHADNGTLLGNLSSNSPFKIISDYTSDVLGVSDIMQIENFNDVNFVSKNGTPRINGVVNVLNIVFAQINTANDAVTINGSTTPNTDVSVAGVNATETEVSFTGFPNIISERVQVTTRDANYNIAISSVGTGSVTVNFNNIAGTGSARCAFNLIVYFDTEIPNDGIVG